MKERGKNAKKQRREENWKETKKIRKGCMRKLKRNPQMSLST